MFYMMVIGIFEVWEDDVYTILKAEPSYISQKKVKVDTCTICMRPGKIHKSIVSCMIQKLIHGNVMTHV